MSYTRVSKKTISFAPSGEVTVDVSRTGERNNNWRRKVKAGESATTYFTRDDYQVVAARPSNASITWHYNFLPGTIFGPYSGQGYIGPGVRVPESHITTDLSRVDGDALALLYKKIRSESSHMNGLQFLGELREALHMIRRPAESIWKGLEKYNTLLSKRKKGIPSRIPRDKKLDIWKDIIAGTWLEISFGWKPLVSDTQDIAETIARIASPDNRRTRVRSYKEDTLGSTTSQTNNQTWGNPYIDQITNVVTSTVGGVQYIVGLRNDAVGPVNQLDRIRNLSGLTLENFVPTLWELCPWSFLIDYFVNVGEIIDCAFTNTTNVLWVQKTERLRTTRYVYGENRPAGAYFNPANPFVVDTFDAGTDGIGVSTIVKSTVTRIPLLTLPMPDLQVTVPGSLNKYLNIAALAAGFKSVSNLRF